MQMTHLDTQFVATLPAALLPFISLCAILLGMAMKFLNKLKKVLGSVNWNAQFSFSLSSEPKVSSPRPTKLGTNH
jgi:hypothetical protein